jgi:hypothetical protein
MGPLPQHCVVANSGLLSQKPMSTSALTTVFPLTKDCLERTLS